jgi:hypothetical protein
VLHRCQWHDEGDNTCCSIATIYRLTDCVWLRNEVVQRSYQTKCHFRDVTNVIIQNITFHVMRISADITLRSSSGFNILIYEENIGVL